MTHSNIAICIATTGRPGTLTETIRDIAAQTLRPDRVILCPAKPGDIDEVGLARIPIAVDIVHGRPGLTAQRNRLLSAAAAADIILFIDDDFILAPTYIAEMQRLFTSQPQCVVATGHVLADGATNRGYTADEGRDIIAQAPITAPRVTPVFNAYGCNMAIRWSRLRGTGCAFDENLPLYGWAEDVDFSRQAAAFGSVLKADAMFGVHLAEKKGRVSGLRFGYSQIANQVYLRRKGTVTISGASRKVMENFGANLIGALRNSEPHVDRRGRLVGNLRGFLDVMFGRSSPGRILEM